MTYSLNTHCDVERVGASSGACASGNESEWQIPPGYGMRRGLPITLANGMLILDSHKPVKCFKESLEMDVYTFSAPRLGNWFLMREYNKQLPHSFNHIFGLDVVPLVPPWRRAVGWRIRSSPMSPLALKLASDSGWQTLNPSKWLKLLYHFHSGDGVIPAYTACADQTK